MNEASYRLLTADDIPAMKEIFVGTDSKYLPGQIGKFMADPKNLAFGAFLDERMVGLLYGYSLCRMDDRGPQFFVYSVDVLPAFQGRGIGTAFFRYAVEYCRENGFCEVFVPTEKGNVPACRVYEKAGGKSDYDDEVIYVIEFDR